MLASYSLFNISDLTEYHEALRSKKPAFYAVIGALDLSVRVSLYSPRNLAVTPALPNHGFDRAGRKTAATPRGLPDIIAGTTGRSELQN